MEKSMEQQMAEQYRPDPEGVTYGETTEAVDYTIYLVEVKWPERGQFPSHWGRYGVGAFNDIDDLQHNSRRGSFERGNADVTLVPERVRERVRGAHSISEFTNALAFTTPAAALACAKRLEERGQVTAAVGVEDWRSKYAGKLRTRVVEERMARIARVVTGVKG